MNADDDVPTSRRKVEKKVKQSDIDDVIRKMTLDIIEKNIVDYIPIIASQRPDFRHAFTHYPEVDIACGDPGCACVFTTLIQGSVHAENCLRWDVPAVCRTPEQAKAVIADYGFMPTGINIAFCTESHWLSELDNITSLCAVGKDDVNVRALASYLKIRPFVTKKFDIRKFYRDELAARARDKTARFLLVCAWHLSPASPFYKDVFPLDMLKLVRTFIVSTYRDPLPRKALECVRAAPRVCKHVLPTFDNA